MTESMMFPFVLFCSFRSAKHMILVHAARWRERVLCHAMSCRVVSCRAAHFHPF